MLSVCNKEEVLVDNPQNLTIFFVNDVHGQIDNFSKVKSIVNAEREKTNVLLVSSGDMFSGNPVIDNYEDKGYPMIDLMNKSGFDVAAIGNHEFDYGPQTLQNRIQQSDFPWLCANVETSGSVVSQPPATFTRQVGDLKIVFLGLIETGGSNYEVIPSSHPWKVEDFSFTRVQDVVGDYANLKEQEDADLYIALSHLGHQSYGDILGDFNLAKRCPYFDLIIGGHSHAIIDTSFQGIPVFQSGSYLHYLGKIELRVNNKTIQKVNFSLINLDSYSTRDQEIQMLIEDYNDQPELYEVIGQSAVTHSKAETGCFYTDALRKYMQVDVTFQNTGGIRTLLLKGDITKKDIYEILPFNNGTIIFEMTVEEIKEFLAGSGSGFYYSGIYIEMFDGRIEIRDLNSRVISDDYTLKVGINDYIPAVYPAYFPDNGKAQALTAAESIIAFLEANNQAINYGGCNSYFHF